MHKIQQACSLRQVEVIEAVIISSFFFFLKERMEISTKE